MLQIGVVAAAAIVAFYAAAQLNHRIKAKTMQLHFFLLTYSFFLAWSLANSWQPPWEAALAMHSRSLAVKLMWIACSWAKRQIIAHIIVGLVMLQCFVATVATVTFVCMFRMLLVFILFVWPWRTEKKYSQNLFYFCSLFVCFWTTSWSFRICRLHTSQTGQCVAT